MDVTFDFQDLEAFFEQAETDLARDLDSIGREAVDYAKTHGNYRDRTGNLRRSNKYEADESGLTVYNDAPYAEAVEHKGYEVISGAILYAEKRLKEEFK